MSDIEAIKKKLEVLHNSQSRKFSATLDEFGELGEKIDSLEKVLKRLVKNEQEGLEHRYQENLNLCCVHNDRAVHDAINAWFDGDSDSHWGESAMLRAVEEVQRVTDAQYNDGPEFDQFKGGLVYRLRALAYALEYWAEGRSCC